MIIQYQEEAIAEKNEFDKMREKVVELEMENDKLKKEIDSYRSQRHSSRVDLDQFGGEDTQKHNDFASKSDLEG